MASVTVGAQLGRYELTGELGQGGMGVVYRAIDLELKRQVAVKVMHGFLADQAESRERFRREAVAVANLRHPHIIEVYDYSGEGAEVSYIVQELVDGQSLASLLGQKALAPPEAALLIAHAIASALGHAHGHGVIHRDLKPENILVDRAGALKLTDFGIARMLENKTLTVTGALLGSPAYMAPEYIDGMEPDARADIFSFGAMLYQLTVGEIPFTGPSTHSVLKRIAAGSYAPSNQQNPHIHAALARITHRCLATDPAARYQSAAELCAALAAMLANLGLDPNRDREALLRDPKRFGEDLCARLAPLYVSAGRRNLEQGRRGAAIDDFDRVLSLDPQHAEVRRILQWISVQKRLWRGAQLGGMGVLGAAVLTFLAVTWRAAPVEAGPEPTPPVVATTAPAERNVTFTLAGRGRLEIDGQVHQAEATGSYAALLAPGQHSVRLVGTERTDERVLLVPARGAVPPVALDVAPIPRERPKPAPARRREVVFNAREWVHMYVDDGAAPVVSKQQGVFRIALTHGVHKLRFLNDYAKPYEVLVTVSDTEPPGVQVIRLEPKDGRLQLTGVPAGGLTVEVAGSMRVLTPINRDDPILVPLGQSREHEVLIEKEGFQPFRKRLTFVPGQTTLLAVQMQPL
jgi:serine/threonine-protein kinase